MCPAAGRTALWGTDLQPLYRLQAAALLRDRVFDVLRRLCPAKLEGKNKGNLISVITSDIELLEVFYAHTISPICIAALYTALVTVFLWSYHPVLASLRFSPMAWWEF